MKTQDIERMAREAGFYVTDTCPLEPEWFHFAALVAAAERDKYEAKFKQLEAIMKEREQQPNKPCCLAEREACAKVCEENGKEPDDHKSYEGYDEGYQDGSNNCAAAIRARGNP